MPRIAIDVQLKPEILDPQGRAIEAAMPGLGHTGVDDVRVGKHLELDVEATDGELEEVVTRLCDDFLVNPIIETWSWRLLTEDRHAEGTAG